MHAAGVRCVYRPQSVATLNLPNALTLLRVLLVPVLIAALLEQTHDGDLLAAIVFALASLTDAVDGYLARSRNAITAFGKLMDPIADKLLIAAALLALVARDRLAVWVALVIIARELAVTALRLVALQQRVVLAAGILGKLKTLLQVAAVMALIAVDDHPLWVSLLVDTAVAVTVLSGVDYFLSVRHRPARRRA